MKMVLVSCVVFLILFSNVIYSLKPAVRVRVTRNGLNYAMNSGITQAKEQLMKFPIPDMKGKLPLLDSYNYSLTGINITRMNIGSTNLRPYPGQRGVVATIRDVDFEFTGNWSLSLWDNLGGDFSVQVTKMSIIMVTSLTSRNGRLVATSVTCASKLHDLDITVGGPQSWVYDLMLGSFVEGFAKSSLPNMACKEAKTRIKTFLNDKFSEIPVKQHLENSVLLDYSVVKDPDFNRDSVDLFLKGEFQPLDNRTSKWTHEPRAQPVDHRRSRMVYVTIMDHMVNSAGEAFYNQGMLTAEVDADQVPKKKKSFFSFSTFKKIPIAYGLKVLRMACPSCGMKIKLEATEAPKIQTSQSGIDISMKGMATLKTELPNQANKTELILAINVTTTATPKLDGTKLATQINNLNINMKILKPALDGPTRVKFHAMKGLVKKQVELLVQKRLSAFEIPLPLADKFKLINPKISYGQHFITLETDIQYI